MSHDDELSPGHAAPQSPFPIVGIGASAGGLEALEALTRRLSRAGMAVVVLQHLAPGHESMLADILARGASLPVVTVRDGTSVERGTIYVTPPSVELTLEESTLHLSPASDAVPRHSIDAFFRSLAADAGSMAIGVILSGAGSDGTVGLRAIKEQGGITFAQSPESASQPSMPESAIDAGCADFTLTPPEIGDELMRLAAHPYVARKRTPHFSIDEQTLARLFEQLRRAHGIDFSAYKLGTIARRIERRMALLKVEKIDDYLELLESNAGELALLYADLLIGVTAFFRDREPFEALKSVVFPRLFDKRSRDVPIRIWVPGCATGEEAYSIAICLMEYLDTRASGFKVQIFGSDIDDAALMRARHAQYPQSIEADVSPDRLQRFFSRQERGYQVARPIRDMVVFARHDLGKDPPFSRLDIISCRNVLIYMQPQLQRKVLRVFHYALQPEGHLLLGTSESVGEASDHFSLVDRKLKIYLKKNTPSSAVFDFALGAHGVEAPVTPPAPAQSAERRSHVSVQQLADRKVLDKFGPPGIVIDDAMEIIQFRGQMRPYLGPSPGAATLSALKVIRPELLVDLRNAVSRAASERLPVTSQPIVMWGDPGDSTVTLEVMPLQEADAQKKCFLVLFRESKAEDHAAEREAKRPPREPRVEDLERELLVTKEYLQTSVQELEGSNQDLQSANEELQSSNEELQSTNEELSTSKEELQSTNEELATVNEELSNRMSQLSVSNDDLQNVLSGASTPLVIVGMDLRIRRFSSSAERLLNLIPGDVGRPIGYLGSAINAPQFESLVAETISTVRERAQRVRCSDGHWYTARVLPYRTSEHAIRGAVIEFLTAPPARKPGEPVEVHEFVGKVLSTLPHVLMLLDEQLRITWVNRAFFETFVVGAEVLGRTLDEVWAGRKDHPKLWDALEESVAGGQPLAAMVVAHPFGRKAERPMRFSARYISSEGDRPAVTLVVMEEVAEGGAV